MAVVSCIPSVERLIIDDRPVEHNLSWAVPEKGLCESVGSFFFGAKNTASIMEVRGLALKGEITMMKAIKNFMNKPITYGAYFKYCTVCASISLALCGWAYYQMSKLNNWVDTKDEESNLEEDEI